MNIHSGQKSSSGNRGPQLAALVAGFIALCATVALWPGGVIGFLQAIAERGDAFAALILAAAIGVFFVILQRGGVPLESSDETTTTQTK